MLQNVLGSHKECFGLLNTSIIYQINATQTPCITVVRNFTFREITSMLIGELCFMEMSNSMMVGNFLHFHPLRDLFFILYVLSQDIMMEMELVGQSKAEVKRKVAKQC